MLERRRKSGKERGGGEMKADFGAAAVGGAAVGGWGVLEKRLWERFSVALRNHLKTKDSFRCDCVSTGEAAAKRSLESCAAPL